MREIMFQSKCPRCKNIDILAESETLKTVHCQRCYNHYDYKLADIKSRIFMDEDGSNSYIYVAIDEMDWLVERAERAEKLEKALKVIESKHYNDTTGMIARKALES